jgi:hypothetical protein
VYSEAGQILIAFIHTKSERERKTHEWESVQEAVVH